jgi:acetyl-CoA acyltransferase
VEFPSVLIVDAVRTPFGPHDSKLGKWHAVDLLAAAFDEALRRSGFTAEDVDLTIAGCAVPIGEQAVNVGRNAALAAGWPESISAHTVDAQGTSGVLALHDAVARIRAGMADVCLVGAVASTRVPDGSTSGMAVGKPFGAAVHDRFAGAGGLRSPGMVDESLANRLGISRQELDAYAAQSRAAFSASRAEEKRTLVELRDTKRIPTVVADDACAAVEDSSNLSPLFEIDGLLTAATFALPVSGATAMVLANADVMKRHKPARPQPALARILACRSVGSSVLEANSGSALANVVLRDLGIENDELEIDVEEDSAVAPLTFARENDRDVRDLNRLGGSLAFGNPFGVAGLASITRMSHHLDDHRRHGVAVSAGSNAISTVTVLEVHTV